MIGKVLEVKMKEGTEFGRNWVSPMYEVTIESNGFYYDLIDNVYDIPSAKWKPIKWKEKEGKTIEFELVKNSGYGWVKFIREVENEK